MLVVLIKLLADGAVTMPLSPIQAMMLLNFVRVSVICNAGTGMMPCLFMPILCNRNIV